MERNTKGVNLSVEMISNIPQATSRCKRKMTKKSKEEVEFEKTKKRMLQVESRNKKPGECLKHMLVIMDSNLANLPCGSAALKALENANIKCETNNQPIPYVISFWRSVTVINDTQMLKLDTKSEDVLQDQIIIYVPRYDFVSLVRHQNFLDSKTDGQLDLESFIIKCSELFGPGVRLTYLILKLDESIKSLRGKRPSKDRSRIDPMMVEQAILCIQMRHCCHFKFVNSDDEFSKMILNFTKSVAECPYKRERKTQDNFKSLYVETSKGVAKLGPEKIWRSQLGLFRNVSVDVGNAIVHEYPSPRSLIEKYSSCSDTREAERLLEDIVVRRGAGIMATVRRVGPELSRKIYVLMSSRNGDTLIM